MGSHKIMKYAYKNYECYIPYDHRYNERRDFMRFSGSDRCRDQILFDAHFTRPSIEKYIAGAIVETNTGLCDRLIGLHHIDRLRAIFISHTP